MREADGEAAVPDRARNALRGTRAYVAAANTPGLIVSSMWGARSPRGHCL